METKKKLLRALADAGVSVAGQQFVESLNDWRHTASDATHFFPTAEGIYFISEQAQANFKRELTSYEQAQYLYPGDTEKTHQVFLACAVAPASNTAVSLIQTIIAACKQVPRRLHTTGR